MSGLQASRDMDLHLKTPRVPRRLAIPIRESPPTLPFPFDCSRTFYSGEKGKDFSGSSLDDKPFSTDLKFFFGRWAKKPYAIGSRLAKMHSRSSKTLEAVSPLGKSIQTALFMYIHPVF